MHTPHITDIENNWQNLGDLEPLLLQIDHFLLADQTPLAMGVFASIKETLFLWGYHQLAYNLCLKFSNHISDTNLGAILENKLDLARCESVFGNHKTAQNIYFETLELAKSIANRHAECKSLRGIGYTLRRQGQTSKGRPYLENALEIANELGDNDLLGKTIHSLANSYIKFDPPKAIGLFQQAINIARNLDDKAEESILLSNSGESYIWLYDYPNAITAFENSIKLAREANATRWLGYGLANLARQYRNTARVSESIDLSEEAIQIVHDTGERRLHSGRISGLATAYLFLGDYPKSEELAKQAIDVAMSYTPRNLHRRYLDMAKIYLYADDIEKMEVWINKAHTLAGNENIASGINYTVLNTQMLLRRNHWGVDLANSISHIIEEEGSLRIKLDRYGTYLATLLRCHDHHKAEVLCQKFIILIEELTNYAPEYFQAWYWRGVAYLTLGYLNPEKNRAAYKDAEDSFLKATKDAPLKGFITYISDHVEKTCNINTENSRQVLTLLNEYRL